ncbi:MAG: hypothetical protein GY859_07445, partial [Desulfobacterales bacterium]|nr:hypothetical protein [Desulfobacterales bacterium]
NSLDVAVEASQIALETGDLEYAAISAQIHTYHSFFSGKELGALEKTVGAHCHTIRKLKQEVVAHWNDLHRQLVINLKGDADDPCDLIGAFYTESVHRQSGDMLARHMYHLYKAILCLLFRRTGEAVRHSDMAGKRKEVVKGFIYDAQFHFYDSLIRLRAHDDAPAADREELLERVAANQEKMALWARHAPMNFKHKHDLVEAERARVLERYWKAVRLYDRAIEGAGENGYIQEKALAFELAGEFYLARGVERVARRHMEDAHRCYRIWGAAAKARDLERRCAQWLGGVRSGPGRATAGGTGESLFTSMTDAGAMDLETVMKASRAISGEIVLDRLLTAMMNIVIEHAGAEKGFLILAKEGEWRIEAEGRVDDPEVQVLQSRDIREREEAPAGLLNYVARTRESVVLRDAANQGKFMDDPTIRRREPKSVLCA